MKSSPWIFFILVYALSIPLWVLNALNPVFIPIDNLPLTDVVATFIPMIAACILVFREEKLDGVKRLLLRAFDFRRIARKTWYAPIFLLMPFIYVLTYWIMRLIGIPLPDGWSIPIQTPLIFIAFLLAASGEELGYMGYAVDPLQERWSALMTCLIMGSIHAIWHWPSCYQMGMTTGLIASGTLMTISFRILSVWLYNNTGKSVSAVILFHAVTNTGRSVFPGSRSALEQADAIVCYGLIAITAVIVVLVWGAKTLARYRCARSNGADSAG